MKKKGRQKKGSKVNFRVEEPDDDGSIQEEEEKHHIDIQRGDDLFGVEKEKIGHQEAEEVEPEVDAAQQGDEVRTLVDAAVTETETKAVVAKEPKISKKELKKMKKREEFSKMVDSALEKALANAGTLDNFAI